jgi:hypothetical protein
MMACQPWPAMFGVFRRVCLDEVEGVEGEYVGVGQVGGHTRLVSVQARWSDEGWIGVVRTSTNWNPYQLQGWYEWYESLRDVPRTTLQAGHLRKVLVQRNPYHLATPHQALVPTIVHAARFLANEAGEISSSTRGERPEHQNRNARNADA